MNKKITRGNARTKSPAQFAKALQVIVSRTDQKLVNRQLIAQILGVNDTADTGDLIPARQAAQQLGCSPKTLANRRVGSSKDLPFVKHGSRVLYRQSDITAFIEGNVRLSTSDTGGAE